MEVRNDRTWFTDRQFVAAIRAELDAAGHRDVPVSSQWIEEYSSEHGYLVKVPVGSAMTIPLRAAESLLDAKDKDALQWHAREFARALVNLKLAEQDLVSYVRDVRTAGIAEITAARAKGLDVLLHDFGLKPAYASHLAGREWKEAPRRVLASLTISHTSFFLRPTTSELWIDEPSDVARELAAILEEQRERQNRIAELDALGADLIVDQITLDLLAAHGLDAGELLTEIRKRQRVNLKVDHRGRDASLTLNSCDGRVSASLMLENAIWNGEHLWFVGDEHLEDHAHLIGRSLGDLVRHPVFASRTIVDVLRGDPDQIAFDLSDKVLFDADARRFWRQERLAA